MPVGVETGRRRRRRRRREAVVHRRNKSVLPLQAFPQPVKPLERTILDQILL